MPERETMKRAKRDLRRGRSASTAAGEFVREEMHHIREGKHGARSTRQAIAIGLSKARRAGVPLKPPARATSSRTRRAAQQAYDTGQHKRTPRAPSRRRATAMRAALKRMQRGRRARAQAARKAARTRRRHR